MLMQSPVLCQCHGYNLVMVVQKELRADSIQALSNNVQYIIHTLIVKGVYCTVWWHTVVAMYQFVLRFNEYRYVMAVMTCLWWCVCVFVISGREADFANKIAVCACVEWFVISAQALTMCVVEWLLVTIIRYGTVRGSLIGKIELKTSSRDHGDHFF